MKNINKYLTPVAIIIAGVLIAATIVLAEQGKFTFSGALSSEEIGEKAVNYINDNLLIEGVTSTLKEISKESEMYKLTLDISGEDYIFYITKDGKRLFPEEGISLESSLSQDGSEPTSVEVPKSDRPDVKLFVMSYCPYGLQSQKMFLPVYDLLKDNADMGVYFVDYVMHEKEEIDENLRQYCIQKEEKDKYDDYLSCFVQNGDFEGCLTQANIIKDKIDSCVLQTDQEYKITESYNDQSTWLNGYYPRFDVFRNLNEQYGIEGSPTVVINDEVVDINPRSPEKFKEVICQAFNNPPAACEQKLSEESFSAGFGLETGSSAGGECQ